MNPISLAFNLINGYKTYSSVILAVASGVGMIATKNYSEGLSQIFQGMTVVFGGASMAGVRHAVAKVENQYAAVAPRT
jgi:RsiW-degrading membrane proteinase PrsW (M82 family)